MGHLYNGRILWVVIDKGSSVPGSILGVVIDKGSSVQWSHFRGSH